MNNVLQVTTAIVMASRAKKKLKKLEKFKNII